MKLKFGDVIKDRRGGAKAVVYQVCKDCTYLADTSFGKYGYDGETVPQIISDSEVEDGTIVVLSKNNYIEAYKRLLFYLDKELNDQIRKYNDNEISINLLHKNMSYTFGEIKEGE